jgi:hypothetical protein
MIGHNKAAMRRNHLPKNYVTATLPILFVANFHQSFNHFTPGDARQHTHASTSTSSSVIGGGTASL